ncbi:hypothetical protein E3N88_41990 [Mikania micrantha]|uniref:Uncharacterized protein n=1 Tax=Mikania micrantha TaxID=192012 RepID=A0A5N6LJ32_9ASTR|nr:hypothetical protein E3N88_41990 [Mikania micrantha]
MVSKLSTYDLIYEPKTTIKSQALADFVADFSSDIQLEADSEVKLLEEDTDEWTLHTDGASNVRGTCLGIILKSPQRDIIPQSISCEFQATNNEAEYEALIAGLQLARDMNIRNLHVFVDSLLIANRFNGSYMVKGDKLAKYLEIVKDIVGYFYTFDITQVPREENDEADVLANLASFLKTCDDINIPILHIQNQAIDIENWNQILKPKNIDTREISWIIPIKEYLQTGKIPDGETNNRAFKIRVSRYIIIRDILYRNSVAGPYLKCLEKPESLEVMKDIHEGDCRNHTKGRALLSKILRTGYFWPTMRKDAMSYSQRCDACQRHGNILHQPAEPLYPVVSSWPFMKWGMDIVGKIPKAQGGKVFMLAMTDYFSKWIEAEAFVQVREKEVISFIKRHILTRFGIPAEITCDNGSQFIGKITTNFCEAWGIKMITSTPVHPQANDQAESSNKIIINNLKKKLGAKKGKWAKELPFVLWADRTTTKNATSQTPFSLVFGSEAVLLTEMIIPTARTNLQTIEANKEVLSQDIDTVDEIRDIAKIRMATYQQKMAKSYNKNIRIRRFQIGDLVLRKAFQNTTCRIKQQDHHQKLKKKLGSKIGKWAEELLFVLWADITNTKNATGQTPFSLVYGSEVVHPTEMVIPTARSSLQNLESNKEILSEDLDTIDELRDIARIRMASYQKKIAKSYNKNIRICRFQVGDLVLRKTLQNTTNPADGKLAPKWEGPYKIESEAGKGAYKLTNMEGEPLPRSWNAIHLKYSRRRDESLCLNPSSDLKSELEEDPAETICLVAKVLT